MLVGVVALVAISSIVHNVDTKFALMRNLGEACAYLSLIFLFSVHFPKAEDMAGFLRLSMLIFVPVALYGFWQAVFGLADFEARYLLSGLTVTVEDYTTNSRVFSTLNSNHSFSVTMACCAVFSILQRHLPASTRVQMLLKKTFWLFFLLFATACLVSLRRTGWLVILFSIGGSFCFGSRLRTGAFYTICLGGGLFVIFSANYLLVTLPLWDNAIQRLFPGLEQMMQLQTFNDRLYSFINLTENGGSGRSSEFP